MVGFLAHRAPVLGKVLLNMLNKGHLKIGDFYKDLE